MMIMICVTLNKILSINNPNHNHFSKTKNNNVFVKLKLNYTKFVIIQILNAFQQNILNDNLLN